MQFVERLSDVPAAWRDRVGFVEMSGRPPTAPAEGRRAARPDRRLTASRTTSVILYSAGWCGYCQQAKRHLRTAGVPYELRDVDVPAAKAELIAKTGAKGIPLLDVGGRVLRGYSAGSYDQFLQEAGL